MFKRQPATVATILGGLLNTVDQLNNLETTLLSASEVAAQQVSRLEAEIKANDAEAARANLVAEKLRDLLGA